MELYRRVYPIIRDGHSTFHGETRKSWRHPQGWQAVLRISKNGKRALLVAHTFGKAFPKLAQIPLAESGWKIDEAWPEKQGLSATLKGKSLQLDLTSEFRACVVSLRQT
jgi:alpha-galactosidase